MVYDFEFYRPSHYSRLYSYYRPVGKFIDATVKKKTDYFLMRLLRKVAF